MTDLPVQLVRLLKRIELLEKKVRDDEIGKYSAHSLKEYFDDEMSEEMKAVADEYIKHEERILKLEKLCNQLYGMIVEVSKETREKLREISMIQFGHFGDNFCGNCAHCQSGINISTCELSGEIIDPDESSCSMFEHPF